MDLFNFLNSFTNVLFIIKDSKGRIVYPQEEQILMYIRELTWSKKEGDFFHPSTENWYQLDNFSYNEHGKHYIVSMFTNITKYKLEQHELELDETTGIYNKKKTFRTIESYIPEALSRKESFSVIMGDIDFFKKVNDTYGHTVGDFVLRHVAQTFIANTRQMTAPYFDKRPHDIVGRVGGEEFAIVLKNITPFNALVKTDSIRQNIQQTPIYLDNRIVLDSISKDKECSEEPLNIDGSIDSEQIPIQITASFGIASVFINQQNLYNDTGATQVLRSDLLSIADEQLYIAKNEGRNCVRQKILKLDNNGELKVQ